MEVLKLDIIGSYYYKPDIEIKTYNTCDNTYCKECVVCKKSLFEPSYEMISNNSKIMNDTEIIIGKCGHIFHEDCLNKWLEKVDTCPIDNVKWCMHRIADTTTKLIMYNNECSFKKNNNKNYFDNKKNDDKKNDNKKNDNKKYLDNKYIDNKHIKKPTKKI